MSYFSLIFSTYKVQTINNLSILNEFILLYILQWVGGTIYCRRCNILARYHGWFIGLIEKQRNSIFIYFIVFSPDFRLGRCHNFGLFLICFWHVNHVTWYRCNRPSQSIELNWTYTVGVNYTQNRRMTNIYNKKLSSLDNIFIYGLKTIIFDLSSIYEHKCTFNWHNQ